MVIQNIFQAAAVQDGRIILEPSKDTVTTNTTIQAGQVLEIPPTTFAAVSEKVHREIIAVFCDHKSSMAEKHRRIGQITLDAVKQCGQLFHHAELRDFESAMFFDGFNKRLLRLRSDEFTAWLSNWLGINRADAAFRYALAQIETAALSEEHSTAILPESFWASRPGAIYLSNGDAALIRVTANGIEHLDNGADGILFPAGRTLSPWKQTEPRDPFETCSLFSKAHCASPHGKELLRLWVYSLPSNPRSKPPLALPGPIGSGKTRCAKGISELYGIRWVASKVEEGSEGDFWPAMHAGGLFVLDNADTKCRWLPDALANAATDGCSQRRKLYTNAETVTLRARAWVAITTANPTFANDSGLADRLLVVRMGRRDDEATSDEALGAEIARNRDAALSHIAQTLRTALADQGPVEQGLNRRHPDFAAFAVRIGRALGREAEAIQALKAAEQDKSAFCLENDAIGSALLAYVNDAGEFKGTAAQLVPLLENRDAELELSSKKLSKRIAALWPHLEKTLSRAKKEEDRQRFTVYTFKA